MRIRLSLFLAAALIALTVSVSTAWAQAVEPAGNKVGTCPPTFPMIHEVHEHEGHGHRHVGTDADQNGDGWVCARHVADGSIHVHVDNNLPQE